MDGQDSRRSSRIEPPTSSGWKDGADYWVCEDRSILGMSAGSQSGVRLETPEKLNLRDVFENVRPGGYDPDERIKDMDLDGVDISLIYTSAGLRLFNQVRDGELLTAIFAAYNDWLAEFCQPFPSRLKGVGMVNVDNVEEAIAELQRCAKLGFAGAMISAYPKETRSYNMPEYEPLWAASQDLDMPISLHVATNRGSELASSSTVLPAHNCTQAYWVQVSIAHMIYTGVFERYPRLQIGAVEAELSWAPHFIDRLDYTYTQRAKRDNWYVLKEEHASQRLFPPERIHWISGRCTGGQAPGVHRGGQPHLGVGLPPSRVHLPQEPSEFSTRYCRTAPRKRRRKSQGVTPPGYTISPS